MLLPLNPNHQFRLQFKTLDPNPHSPLPLFFFINPPYRRTRISQNREPLKFSPQATSSTTEILPNSAIQRIAEKLRSLGYVEEDSKTSNLDPDNVSAGEIFVPLSKNLPKYRVGHTIDSSWSTPENPTPLPGSGHVTKRLYELVKEVKDERRREKKSETPTLAEIMLPEEELRRLRGIGIGLKKKLKIGKAGITEGIVNGIHERWRNSEVVRIKCEDLCKLNMKRTHDMLERKTGGLVVWRSGSNIILYRGANYEYPYFDAEDSTKDDASSSALPDLDVESVEYPKKERQPINIDNDEFIEESLTRKKAQLMRGVGSPSRVRFQLPGEAQLVEEVDRVLDGLGPRFTDWWGYEPLPVDADLLPAVVPGYRRPFRLLPYGVQPKLTNDEMTTLRRLGRPLPCHFALGRNRRLQGLAASMIKLWEKCEIAKIAVKRGVQNTNSEIIAEELKRLTGGTLLSRDREFIVFYRGKDFLPFAVSSAIDERRKYGMLREKQRIEHSSSVINWDEEKTNFETKEQAPSFTVSSAIEEQRNYEMLGTNQKTEQDLSSVTSSAIEAQGKCDVQGENWKTQHSSSVITMDKEEPNFGTTEQVSREELDETNDQKKNDLKKPRSTESSFEKTSIKLAKALEKKEKAERVLAQLDLSEIPQEPEVDKEGITEEERYMLRKVGLRMKPFLLLGRRGVFAGTIENMHLHWKYRELVKVISNGRSFTEVHNVAQILEAESGGILVAVERVRKGYATIMYRGKNYKRPVCLRPPTLLNKRQAMKRSLEAQRRESLKLHVLELTKNIGRLKHQLDKEKEMDNMEPSQFSGLLAETENGSLSSEEIPGYVKKVVEADLTSTNSDDGLDPSKPALKAAEEDHMIDFSLENKKNNKSKTDPGSLSEAIDGESRFHVFLDKNGKGGDVQSSSSQDNPMGRVSCFSTMDAAHGVSEDGRMDSFGKLSKDEFKLSVPGDVIKRSNFPIKVTSLSNRDRLLLRKQALRMKKQPLLSVGRSNVVSGVAKAIKAHFERYPLAIVNVKGRAKGTSVQEVVFKLEQATGAILVSQEPSKVILYRGWGLGGDHDVDVQSYRRNSRKASVKRVTSAPTVVSPELIEAIRVECGLLQDQERASSIKKMVGPRWLYNDDNKPFHCAQDKEEQCPEIIC
ncbi:RNA-binding, CRM domain, partial [Dillenia turbinata]